jgi:alkylation response protein AidB-like acyl-CoA dehydrogenase
VKVGLNESQLELRANVRAVLAAECPASMTRRSYTDSELWRPLWKTVVGLGWTALSHADESSGLGSVELAVVLEECGAATLPVPLLSSVGHAAGALRHVGARQLLDELSEGCIGTLLASPAGSRTAGPVLTWSGGRLTGTAPDVPEASRADLLVSLVEDSAGVLHLAAFRPGAGVVVDVVESLDPSRPLGHVHVDVIPELCVPVAAPDVLAAPLVASAAELVGVADRALALSVEYAKARHQFGQPIGAFQGVKHRLADAYVSLERARSLTYLAAAKLAEGRAIDAISWRAALLAKAAANEAASNCTRSGVAVHGAIGQTWEHDMHLLLRRAWQGSAHLGESRALYASAARSYVEENAKDGSV